MNTLDLNKMGLASLEQEEMQNIEGGSIFGRIAIAIGAAIAIVVAPPVGLALIGAGVLEEIVNPTDN